MGRVAPARLFVILARKAPTAVVFRRGPSDCVLLSKWDLAHDAFEHGQWFKGRIYERRCDLSPQGDKLIYFAANHKPPHGSWTAVSTPPYLTALALWSWKWAGTWGGGGLFEAEKRIRLGALCAVPLAEGFRLPKTVKVEPADKGDKLPTYYRRLVRDGWRVTKQAVNIWDSWVLLRPHPVERSGMELEMEEVVELEATQPKPLTEYRLRKAPDGFIHSLGFLDWADWDRNGDLLFARQGGLFRVKTAERTAPDLEKARLLADFNGFKFEKKVAPDRALKW